MSEWKDSYESGDSHGKDIVEAEKERLRLMRLEIARSDARLPEQIRMQKLNLGICIYRDFGRDQGKWPEWIRAMAAELGIE